jgi:hypothetical protein
LRKALIGIYGGDAYLSILPNLPLAAKSPVESAKFMQGTRGITLVYRGSGQTNDVLYQPWHWQSLVGR